MSAQTKRPWLQFSLRTLLLLVVAIGSGAMLSWYWEPWGPSEAERGEFWYERREAKGSAITYSDGRWKIGIKLDKTKSEYPGELIVDAQVSLDGKRLAIVFDIPRTAVAVSALYIEPPPYEVVRIWNVETSALLAEFPWWEAKLISTEFSPDGRRIMSVTPESLGIWDAATGHLLARLEYGDGFTPSSANFSKDGQKILAVSQYGKVRIWQLWHPEQWWGVFCLWQFWFVSACAIAFLWSVWRDGRELRISVLGEAKP